MKKKIIIILVRGLLTIVIGVLTGCGSSWYARRNINRQHLYNYTYPNELAKDCGKWFPFKDSISNKVLPGNNIDYSGKIDSLQLIVDSIGLIQYPLATAKPDTSKLTERVLFLKNQISQLKSAYKPCKPDTVVHFVLNTAQLNILEQKNKIFGDSLLIGKTQLTQVKKNRITWMLIAIGGMAVIFTSIVVKVYTFVTKG